MVLKLIDWWRRWRIGRRLARVPTVSEAWVSDNRYDRGGFQW